MGNGIISVYTLENDDLSEKDEFDQIKTQNKRIWSKQILTAGLKNKARRRKGRRGGESPSLVVTMALQPVLARHHSPRNKSTENGLNTDRPKKAPILALMVSEVHFAQMGRRRHCGHYSLICSAHSSIYERALLWQPRSRQLLDQNKIHISAHIEETRKDPYL